MDGAERRKALTLAGLGLLAFGGVMLLGQKPAGASQPSPPASTSGTRRIRTRGQVPVYRVDGVVLGYTPPDFVYPTTGALVSFQESCCVPGSSPHYSIGFFSGTAWAGPGYVSVNDAALI